jgi:tRNA G18 (ribose-2'-O)-methylase SpoU
MYLTGYTPAPLDRFGRINKEIEKTSLGASASVPFECSDVEPLVKGLKSKGVKIVAVEQTEKATDYRMFMPSGDVAYIFGNEITGIEPEVLTHAHEHIQIPLAGMKESLNVSVCAGIILFSRR